MQLDAKKHYLIKYSLVEAGKTWWFLNEIYDAQHFEWCRSKTMLCFLKDIKVARFVKRYKSEVELDIDVDLMYLMHEIKHV